MILGGLHVKNIRSTTAWGVSASSASATLVSDTGGSFSVAIGSAISYSYYGLFTQHAIVTRITSRVDFSAGVEQEVEMVDNRIRLQWQHVFAAWNMEDETCQQHFLQPNASLTKLDRDDTVGGQDALDFETADVPTGPDAVVFPGGYVVNPERRRRYWSILPEHWDTRTRTYHDQPFTLRQILNSAFNGSVGHSFGFARVYGNRADEVRPLGIDHLSGISLAGLITEMNEKTALDLYLMGRNTLVWDVKGFGSFPVYPTAHDQSYTIGESLSTEPTRIRVIGDPVIMQMINIELKPTWNRKWEAFIGEAAWLREVAKQWEISETEHWAEIAARAREITLGEYCRKVSDFSWADYGYFGQMPRMAMPCWSYIEELVFKHYAVPPENKLFGVIPQDSIRISDQLLCNVQMKGDGLEENTKMEYQREPLEYYPGAKAYIIVKGQPLDALDTRDIAAFHNLRVADTRRTWRVETDYEIDSCGVGIRFRTPVFIDGDPAANESIFFFPNQGQKGYRALTPADGVPAASELMKIVMPNPDYKITPAEVKASFAFALAPFWQEYGKGPRFGVINANGLTAHLLHVAEGDFSPSGLGTFEKELLRLPDGASVGTVRELLYADGDSVADKAYAAWRSREGVSSTTQDGGYQRVGLVGTQLGGAVDRVSVSMGFSEGNGETVDLVKQRIDRAFIAEKTLNRLRRMPELYSGQEELRREVRNLRRIVEADRYKPQSTKKKSVSHHTMNDVSRVAVGGGMDVQTKVVRITEQVGVKAGHILWANEAGVISTDGKSFVGIAIHALAGAANKGNLNAAYAGRVPVLLSGKFKPGGIVYAVPGKAVGVPEFSSGLIAIGTYIHADEIKNDVEFIGLVHLGLGGTEIHPAFYVDLITKKGGEAGSITYAVTVTHGEVIERDLTALQGENSLFGFPCTNRTNEDGSPAEFAITPGQAIYVVVTESALGNIDRDTDIVLGVFEDNKPSRNSVPGVQVGVYYYRLASLIMEEGIAKVRHHAGKSNIYHTSGLTADFIIRDCPGPEDSEGSIKARLSHVSGLLVTVDKSIEERPLAEVVVEIEAGCDKYDIPPPEE